VIIAQDCDEAAGAIHEMMNEGKFGDAGRRIVVEEFLRGTECSCTRSSAAAPTACSPRHAITSARSMATRGRTRRHGRRQPGDNWSAEAQEAFEAEVMRPLAQGLMRSGIAFSVCCSGLMMTAKACACWSLTAALATRRRRLSCRG
jgi:phosphoribosylamine--glycine ligase